jgi:hypothetical protein
MLAKDWPKSHGMTTVFKDYLGEYHFFIGEDRTSGKSTIEPHSSSQSLPHLLNPMDFDIEIT